MPEDILVKSIEMELLNNQLNESQRERAMETVNKLTEVMDEFRTALQHIKNDGRLSPQGKMGDVANLKQQTDSRLSKIGDDRLSQLDARINELVYLTRPQPPETDPQLEFMRQQECRAMLKETYRDELELQSYYVQISISGENDLAMRSIEQSPVPMLSDKTVLENGRRTRGERQSPENSTILRQLKSVRNTIQATVNGYRTELNLPDPTIENIGQATSEVA